MSSQTQKLYKTKPCKHSVQFGMKEGESKPLFQSVYLMREAMKDLGIKDLDKVEKIEITVRVIK